MSKGLIPAVKQHNYTYLFISITVFLQLSAYGGSVVYTVSYTTDQREQMAIRVTSEPDLIIEVSFQTHIKTQND